MACDKLPTCMFFNDQLETMPGVAELLKTLYCRGAFEQCARFRVAAKLGAAFVPHDLYPNHAARADEMVAYRES